VSEAVAVTEAARHIVLVGPMGAGKTTVGAVLASRLGRPFVDTDDLVVASTGHSVAEVFAREGEAGFRAHERHAVADACAAPVPSVISCGGGAVLDSQSRALLGGVGIVVWLDAPGGVLADRLGEGSDRPLLAGGDPATTLERIRELRSPAYDAVAGLRIDTAGRSIAEVVEVVVVAISDAGEEAE